MDKQTIPVGWLIDGTGAAAAKNMRLTIEAGRIISIEPADSETPNSGNPRLDLSDHTLLPTLCDCHVHLAISGSLDPARRSERGSLEYKAMEPIISGHIRDCLRHGVLSVRDGGDCQGHVLQYKTDCEELNRIPFRLRTPGIAWYREGRYGKFIGRAVSAGKDPAPDMEAWTRQSIDHIKVIQSGINSLSTFGRQTEPQFEKEALSRIFRLCKSSGIGLMIHANGEIPVGIAVDAGCDSIEHGFFMGNENLQKMADSRITWVPTVVAMKAYAEHAPLDSVESQVARKTMDHQLAQLSSARQYGVPVALGTDAGSPGVHHGRAVAEELRLLVSAGYSIEEAISCATMNAATLMKREVPGRLSVGAPASFVAVKGSPSEVPDRLSSIDLIMVSGRLITLSQETEK